jgi:hypothetical protein
MAPQSPDMHRLLLGVALMIAMLTAMGIVRMLIDRSLAADDPRRQLVPQVLLYVGTAILLLAMLWLRRR